MTPTRRLAAILAADVAGYSGLMGADEQGTLNRLRTVRTEIVDPAIAQHRGRIVKTTGDGLLVEFTSIVDALQCATEIQAVMAERNTSIETEKRIELRMGINVGDIVVEEDGDIFGDSVSVAARLEGLADPGGICVSARVQEDAAGKLDLSFADMGEQNLKNIARAIHAYRVRLEGVKSQSTVKQVGAAPVLPLPDKPSIAVLPFVNMSGDPEQEYFADGMVEEIITALSRIRWLFVIARNSTFTYKGQSVDVKQVGRELGVRYVLEGSVRKAGGRVRITAQLIDALGGTHLWADRFDGSLEDIFELQENVAITVAGVIEPTLQATEIHRASKAPTRDLTAYDLYLRALASFPWSGKVQLVSARDLLDEAIERDPLYAPAIAWSAVCHLRLGYDGYGDEPEISRRKALALAERALALDDRDPGVLANAAHVLGISGEDVYAAIALVDRSVTLNPSNARGWYVSGFLRVFANQYEEAMQHLERSLRLSPRGYLAAPRYALGMAYFFTRRLDQAAEMLSLSIREVNFPGAYRSLASCYAHMGRLNEARAVIERLRATTPEVIPRLLPYSNPEQRELLLSGLRLAAGEMA